MVRRLHCATTMDAVLCLSTDNLMDSAIVSIHQSIIETLISNVLFQQHYIQRSIFTPIISNDLNRITYSVLCIIQMYHTSNGI